MPEETPPEVAPDRRSAKALLEEKAAGKRREAAVLERVAELVERGTPLGDLFAEAWYDYYKDKSSVNMETAVVSAAKLEVAQAIAVSYLENKVKFTTDGPRAVAEAVADKAAEQYFQGLATTPIGQPSPQPPGLQTLIDSSASFAEFKVRAGDAAEAQVAQDLA